MCNTINALDKEWRRQEKAIKIHTILRCWDRFILRHIYSTNVKIAPAAHQNVIFVKIPFSS